jgi:MarR family 2-MHQ and catechol resistance regulon transcriptional repressor
MSEKESLGIPQSADVWLVIRKASYWVQQHAQESVAATGLGLTDFAVLKALLYTGPLPVNTIGSKVLLTSGSITSAVDRLEAEGLVKREPHPTDRRAFLVGLTRAGKNKIRPASLKHAQRMAGVVSVLTPGEQQELVRLMKKLGKHAMQTRGANESVLAE